MSGRDPTDEQGALTDLARGFRARTLTTLRLAGRLGIGMARRSVGLGQALEQVDEEDAVRAAGVLLGQLDGLKGLMMKFGLFVNRLQWGLNSVLAHLDATGPWPELFRRAVESPTEPLSAT
jgi:hypothetical protein